MPLPVTLDHCVIHVTEWERSNAFYRDVMGAELVQRPVGWAYRFGDRQLNVHGPGVAPAEVARLPVQPGNSDLCFEWNAARLREAIAHLGRHCGVAIQRGPLERFGAKGAGYQRLFPRSRRVADGIHVVPSEQQGRLMTTAPHNPNVLPDAICRPRKTMAQPATSPACGCRRIALAATDGSASRPVHAVGAHRCLHLSAHRRARTGAARTAGMRSLARAAARRSPARSVTILPT